MLADSPRPDWRIERNSNPQKVHDVANPQVAMYSSFAKSEEAELNAAVRPWQILAGSIPGVDSEIS
jgi:hypothetical protein